MSYLLEILGRGLVSELTAAFRERLDDDGRIATADLKAAAQAVGRSPLAERGKGARCWTALGRRHLANRDYAAARDAFGAAQTIDPDDADAHVGLACACDALGEGDRATQQLLAAQARAPRDPLVQFALGFCYEKADRTADAVAAYHAALEVAPQLRNAHERLAAIFLQRDDLDRAIEHYEHLCWCEPGDVPALLSLANLYVQTGRYEDAVRRYQFALTIEPDNWEARDDLVSAYEQAGLLREAIDELVRIIQTKPAFADNHLRLGDLYVKIGVVERAVEQFGRALELSPDYLEATVKLGTAHLRNGSYLDAAQCFSRAVEINDRLLTAYVGLGVAQHESGSRDEALASFELAASVEPNSTLLFSEMARLQLKASVNRQAQRFLSVSALADQASVVAAGTPAGEGPSTVSDLVEEQIRRLRSAVERRPNHADLHYRLGLLLRHRGQLDEAIRSFHRAVEINPNYAKALIKLGLAYHAAGRVDEAVSTLRRALQLRPDDARLHYELGLMFSDRQEFALAVERFESAVRHEPGNVDFQANLALALQSMGMLDRSASAWRTLAELTADGQDDALPLRTTARR